ncbi:hypothetical protein S245_070315 [Arachis hypogaea]
MVDDGEEELVALGSRRKERRVGSPWLIDSGGYGGSRWWLADLGFGQGEEGSGGFMMVGGGWFGRRWGSGGVVVVRWVLGSAEVRRGEEEERERDAVALCRLWVTDGEGLVMMEKKMMDVGWLRASEKKKGEEDRLGFTGSGGSIL